MGVSRELYNINFQINTNDFQSHGNKCTFSSLINEQLHFLHWSVRGILYDLTNVSGPFSVILQPWNFCKLQFIYISCALDTARKLTKISWSFATKIRTINLQSTLDVMNFQKWKLFSGSPGIFIFFIEVSKSFAYVPFDTGSFFTIRWRSKKRISTGCWRR